MILMTKKLKIVALFVVFILGYTNFSFELIILRQLVNFIGSNTLIISVIMSTILMFLSVGYYIGSIVKFSKYPIRKMICFTLLLLTMWYMFSCFYYSSNLFFFLISKITREHLVLVFAYSFLFLIIPSLGVGFLTSVLGRVLHHYNSDYTGRFMATDTIGSVIGSLVTTLLIMPFLGISYAVVLLIIMTAFLICLLGRKKDILLNTIIFILCSVCAFTIRYFESTAVNGILIKDDAVSRLEIIQQDGGQSVMMRINGQPASKISENSDLMFKYVNFINKNFIDNLNDDKVYQILVLGAGGFTIGLNDKKNQYTFLDIEKNLKKIAEEFFLPDPLSENKQFMAQDAYLYMINTKQQYDIIIVDVYSSLHNIPEHFVTVDFFKKIKDHLSKNGIMLANIITSPSFENKFAKRIDNTLRQVLPRFLSRQVIGNFNPYSADTHNIIYIFYNRKTDDNFYTIDKNSAMYGQM